MNIYRIVLPEKIYVNQTLCIESDHQGESHVKEYLFPVDPVSDIAVDHTFHIHKYGFPLSQDEVNSFIIHREIWKDFLSSSEPVCMIIESNVNLNVSIEEIKGFLDEIDEEWDILMPYDLVTDKSDSIRIFDRRYVSIWNPSNAQPYLLGLKWGHSIYFLTKRGAEVLLEVNKIAQRLDDEFISLDLDGKISLRYTAVDWLMISQIDWKEWPSRTNLILETIYNCSFWTSQSKEQIREILRVISQIGRDNNIDIILNFGTHLGYIRHGGIIPWDDDVDLAINEKDLDRFFKALEVHEDYQYGKFIWEPNNSTIYKIWNKKGEPIENHHHTFPFVDIWPYEIKENDILLKCDFKYPNTVLHGLEEVEFEGSTFMNPVNSIEVLDSFYHDWKTQIRVFTWSHRLEKNHFPPLSFPIEVDEKGKLIKLSDC